MKMKNVAQAFSRISNEQLIHDFKIIVVIETCTASDCIGIRTGSFQPKKYCWEPLENLVIY